MFITTVFGIRAIHDFFNQTCISHQIQIFKSDPLDKINLKTQGVYNFLKFFEFEQT